MKTGKKVLLGCASMVAIVVVLIAALAFLIYAKKNKYDKIVFPYLNDAIAVLAKWEPESFSPYWAPEVLEQIPDERLERLFLLYRKLGTLESFEDPEFLKVGFDSKIPYPAYVQYQVTGHFETGPAVLSFTLVRDDSEHLHVWYLQINSDEFLPKIEAN